MGKDFEIRLKVSLKQQLLEAYGEVKLIPEIIRQGSKVMNADAGVEPRVILTLVH
ncbi:hypothetical protein N9R54_04725 [Pelobium sp.]|nr:hypothetical protein [Pelobium sp.]MDA9555520.1 hypothetical protein [Pelobium sp.]